MTEINPSVNTEKNTVIKENKALVKVLSFFVLFFLITTVFLSIKLFQFNEKKSLSKVIVEDSVEENVEIQPIDRKELSGYWYYYDENNLFKQDVKTGEVTTAYTFPDGYYPSQIVDEYLFTISYSNSSVKRYNFIDSSEIELPVEMSGAVAYVIPSPDKSKTIVTLASGYGSDEGSAHIVDFEKQVSKKLFESDARGAQWFSDNRHILHFDYNQTRLVDTETGKNIQVNETFLQPFAVSPEKLRFLTVKKDEIGNPILVNEHIGKYFPSITDDELTSDKIISSYKFPVVARDFNQINKIVTGLERDFFILEIEAGTRALYFTDSGNTFKKITPQNSANYSLIEYSPESNLVLAYKDNTLVAVDVANYSEHNVGIPDANFKEYLLSETDEYRTDDIIELSPDGEYVFYGRTKLNDEGTIRDQRENKVVEIKTGREIRLDNFTQGQIFWTN